MERNFQTFQEQLDRIERASFGQKSVLTFSEGCSYVGITESHMYKLTSKHCIPFSKPEGKKIFFDRLLLDKWLMRNPIKTQEEIDMEASTYVALSRGKGGVRK